MTEPKDLLLLVEQLRRSNRRWKTLALTACFALALMFVGGLVAATVQQTRANAQQTRANAQLRAANAALAEAHKARVEAQQATNPPPPR
jgi:cell division protein FtsB